MANLQQENQIVPELPHSKNTVIARNEREICLRPTNDANGGFTIDAADFDLIRNHSWRVGNTGYMIAKIRGVHTKLHHHLIGKPPAGQVCDHINRNKMRNTRDNLRFVSFQENNQNKGMYSNNTTGYRGVLRYKNKFMAQVKHGGRAVYSKVCATAEEAARVWNENVVRFRNIHVLNDVDDDEPNAQPEVEPEAQQ